MARELCVRAQPGPPPAPPRVLSCLSCDVTPLHTCSCATAYSSDHTIHTAHITAKISCTGIRNRIQRVSALCVVCGVCVCVCALRVARVCARSAGIWEYSLFDSTTFAGVRADRCDKDNTPEQHIAYITLTSHIGHSTSHHTHSRQHTAQSISMMYDYVC
jgi:hypothetical protein